MTNPTKILQALKHGTDNLAKEICAKHGYKTPYEILFKDLDNLASDREFPPDIIINPGNPPIIIMNQTFVLWCLIHTKKIIYRHKLASALEHLHLMHRTLRHPIPLSKAIALRKESKNWVKILAPNLTRDISIQHLKITYSVTVEDVISNISITLHGDDPESLKDSAIHRLSNQVYENEDYEDMHERLKEISQAKSIPVLPSQIIISGLQDTTNIKVEY